MSTSPSAPLNPLATQLMMATAASRWAGSTFLLTSLTMRSSIPCLSQMSARMGMSFTNSCPWRRALSRLAANTSGSAGPRSVNSGVVSSLTLPVTGGGPLSSMEAAGTSKSISPKVFDFILDFFVSPFSSSTMLWAWAFCLPSPSAMVSSSPNMNGSPWVA